MKKFYILLAVLAITGMGMGQTTIHSESFESTPNGSAIDYSIDTEFGGTDPNDYFQRITITGNGKDEIDSGVTGGDGSYMIAGEDIDGATPTPKVITIVEVSVSGYSNITVTASFGSGEQNKYDAGDYIKLFVKKDGGSEELVAAFYGYDHVNGDATNGRMYEDENLDGSTSDDSNNELSKTLTDYTYSIIGVTNTLQVIVKMTTNSADEVLMIDNVRMSGTPAGGVNNPTAFTSTTISTSEIDLSWTRNTSLDTVMVVWSPDATIGTPADGSYYAVGDTIPGGDSVIFRGVDTTYAHTGLNSGTTYYYKAFSVDGSTAYSSGSADNAATYKDEPTNHVSTFAAGTPTALSIPLSWNDNDGTVAADGFLVMINTTGTFTAPVDGTPQADDTDVSDGVGQVNVSHGIQTYTWTNLQQNTHYYFTIYPYSNSGATIDYKTDGTVPTADTTTTTVNTGLIISEVADPNDIYQGRFVELYNTSSDTIFFGVDTWYLVKQSNGGSFSDIQLVDTIPPGETYTVAYSATDFSAAYGVSPNLVSGSITGNGDDGYFLYYGGNESTGTLIDAYGVIGDDGTGKAWEYLDGKAVRKRSVETPNTTWTATEWVITRPADVVNMTPGQHFNYVSWQGTTDSLWNTKANWDNGFIPDVSMDVTIASSSKNPIVAPGNYAWCWDLTVNSGATLTVKSDAFGQGSLIMYGSSSGNVNVECYTVTGNWHGVAAPVTGLTASSLYLNGNPDVWLKYYNELDNTYDYITGLGTSLGTMKGWMIWVDTLGGTLTDTTYTFVGSLRSGTVSPSESIVRSQPGNDYGFNFVGNPFAAVIDWNDTLGWTKTSLNDAIYIYNDTAFASYVGGTGTNGGTQYIAMNQGFFVQVADDSSTNATLQATPDVCKPHSASFMKAVRSDSDYSLIRLQINNGNASDETVVKLKQDATDGFDGNYDAHKLFSFNTNVPQIFSTANGNMSINTLPLATRFVNMDVTGKNGDIMTITATQRINMNKIWLVDELTGVQTDLIKEPYTFTYDNTFSNRFTLYFSVVGVNADKAENRLFRIYASQREINVVIPDDIKANIEIYNILGQKVAQASARSGLNRFALPENRYYIVKVYNGAAVETQKVIVGR